MDEVMAKHCQIRFGDNTARKNWRRAVQVASYTVAAKPVMAKLLAVPAVEPIREPEGEQRKQPTSRTRPFTSTKADPDDSNDTTERKHLQRLAARKWGPSTNAEDKLIHQEFEAYGEMLQYMVAEISKLVYVARTQTDSTDVYT